MSPVFGHGRLRLYLLKLLAEQPRHGYEMIRMLEDHFEGMYTPSAGTIYPRLARLESEGLVTHSRERGRKVYRITDAGLAELRRRQDELEVLEDELDDSVAGLVDIAREIHEGLRDTVQGLKHDFKMAKVELKHELKHGIRHDLKQAAWDVAAHQWDQRWGGGAHQREDRREGGRRPRRPEPGSPGHAERGGEERFERLLDEFGRQASRLASVAEPSEAQLGECVAILDEALERLRVTLTRDD